MKAWMLFVLLAVIVVGAGIASWQGRLLPGPAAESQRARAGNTQAEVNQPTGWVPPSMEAQLSGLRPKLHEADQVFIGKPLGGDGCPLTEGGLGIPAHGSFIVTKVLKGIMKEGDLVSGRSIVACFPSALSPFFKDIPSVMVVGRWEGSAPLEEELGSVSVPFPAGKNQIHDIYITELIAYSQPDEQRVVQIVLQMLSCREAHQVFWVGQPPGTAQVIIDPEQPPEGTSVSFFLCITEENWEDIGEVEMWNYVFYDWGYQAKEGLSLDGLAIRNVFNVVETPYAGDDGVWYFAAPVGGPGARHSFSLRLPKGRYEPFLSDQDVYVFSQKNNLVHPLAKEAGGEPVDILRGALWIPKPKGQ